MEEGIKVNWKWYELRFKLETAAINLAVENLRSLSNVGTPEEIRDQIDHLRSHKRAINSLAEMLETEAGVKAGLIKGW